VDNFWFVETENKIDDQGSGLNGQAYENDLGHNMQAFKYEVVSF